MSLLPRDRRFSLLFQQGAENDVKMAAEFKQLVDVWENVKERVSILNDMERDGDAITHDVITMLHRTFITPFDREDISLLARSLDDIADRIHSTADTMLLCGINRPSDRAKEMADILAQATVEVEKAVQQISGHIEQNQLLRTCVEINRLEDQGDNLYRRALAELFVSKDLIDIIKWREVYEDIESAIDGTAQVANALEGIALKYA